MNISDGIFALIIFALIAYIIYSKIKHQGLGETAEEIKDKIIPET